jgi:hypothetical protein
MSTHPESERTDSAYCRLKQTIDTSYPHGWFVAIAGDQIVGASADFHKLESQLRESGKDPRKVLIVEAGVDYPESVTIFI